MKRFFYSFIGLLVYWFIGLLAFSLTALPARAQENWVDSDYARCLEAAEGGEVCKSAYASSVQSDLQADLVRKILGPVPGVTVTADAWQRNPEYVRKMAAGAAVPQIGNFIAMMYANPPADLALWIRDTGESLGFIPKQAYAQGIGFSGLAPLLPIWKAFRNIAYFLLAIVLVIIGFMVMLRKKIDPKTVVTVQNALPRVVVALLLITFSYAIVGVLIDIMYLMILLLVMIFQSSGLLPDYALKEISTFTTGGVPQNINMIPEGDLPWRIIAGIDPKGWGGALSIAGGTVGVILGLVVAGFTGFNPAGIALAGLGMSFILLSLLIGIGMLLLMIRLFIFFLGAYIKIIVATLTGPLYILAEAVPGSTAFSSWIRDLISNIIVFPVGTAMFLLAHTFMKLSSSPETLWNPPYVSLWVNNATAIGTLIALGILFSIPTVVGQLQEVFKAKPIVDVGVGAIGGVFGQPISFGWQITQFLIQKHQMDQLRAAVGGKQQSPKE